MHARHTVVNTEPAEASSPRRRRAVALTALALIAIAVAGFVYLRPASPGKPQVTASEVNLLQVSSYPMSFAFVTPQMGWASTVVAQQSIVFRTNRWRQALERQLLSQATLTSRGKLRADLSPAIRHCRGFITVGNPIAQFYRTADGGATWPGCRYRVSQSTRSNSAMRAMLVIRFVHVYGRSRLRLFATHDAGDTWSRLPDPPPGAVHLPQSIK